MNTTDSKPERWKAVPGYEGYYEVSDLARYRSVPRVIIRSDGKSQPVPGALLTPDHFGSKGYLRVHLSRDNRVKTKQLHRVVLEAFVGECPEGMQACHNDGDPAHCALTNLRWDTPSANTLDTVKHGTHHCARKTHCKHGHEFTPDNTIVRTYSGTSRQRQCRACNVQHTKNWRAQQREMAVSA